MSSYSITKTEENVTLVFGSIPVSDFVEIVGSCPKNSISSILSAKMANATFAFGLEEDCIKFQERIYPERLIEIKNQYPDLSIHAQMWIASCKGGLSSYALFYKATGISLTDASNDAHPHDAADFKRCRILLDNVPETSDTLNKMTKVSDAWEKLVRNWEEICNLMDNEAPNWRSNDCLANNTSNLIKSIIK